jgi:hypothetical protein
MKRYALTLPVLWLSLACASVTGSQAFETSSDYTLPTVGSTGSSQVITAAAAAGTRAFAESVLGDLDKLRDNDHVDSADASIRIVEIQLSTDTTFAGMGTIQLQLVTATESVPLCSHTLTAQEAQQSSFTCSVDYQFEEAALRNSDASRAPAKITVQLQTSGATTATKLTTKVTFAVEVDADVSL